MKSVKICLVVLGVLALAFITMPMKAQNQEYPFPGFPPEFSPLVTWRPEQQQRPLVPSTKFVKSNNPIANHYIVVLNDDVVSSNAPLEARRAQIATIANSHALAHLGKVGYIYEMALKGYSIELPNEAAAMAISNSPQVKWVEEDERFELDDEPAYQPEFVQTNPPWGLSAISFGVFPTATPDANGRVTTTYGFNAKGTGVNVYVLDTGINSAHQDFSTGFFPRASVAADCIAYANCQSGAPSPILDSLCTGSMPNSTNNDCWGHGTHVAGTVGGNDFGAAKEVTIKSVKVCTVSYGCRASEIIAGVNWVTNNHLANPGVPAVANMSLGRFRFFGYNPPNDDPVGVDNAVNNSINNGVTYVVSAGNDDTDATQKYPADVAAALTVGAVAYTGRRASPPSQNWGSNWGPGVDLFAPGVDVVSALSGAYMLQFTGGQCWWQGGNNQSCILSGTSMAAPHVAGAVAMYLQNRTGVGGSCSLYPIQGPAPSGGDLSTCPDRVTQFIKANTFLSRLANINGTDGLGNSIPSPNRFLSVQAIPTTLNPLYNHRFFVWRHYADFLTRAEPDEAGLDWWTKEITGNPIDGHGCNVGVDTDNPCTNGWRISTSRSFWVAIHQDWFTGNYGLVPYTSTDPVYNTANKRFLRWAYKFYLQREPNGPPDNNFDGFNFWLTDLTNNYGGDPANQDGVRHIIDMFINSPEYRRRFGQS